MKKYLVKGTKLTRDSILENQIRNKIFEYISNNPGTHQREIRNELNVTPYQAIFHLKMLEKFAYIKKSQIKNRVAYFDAKIDPKFHEVVFNLKDQKNIEILKCILSETGIPLNEIVNKSHLKLQIVKKIILDLKKSDLIHEKIENGRLKYYPDNKKVEIVFKILKIPDVFT